MELIGVNNDNTGEKLIITPVSGGIINVRIPSLPFYSSGYYYIDLYLGDGQKDYDIIQNAARFFIENTDVYLSGFPPPKHINPVFVNEISFTFSG